ncbi:MAG: DUF1800 family protein [Candidatus Caenarcaniphilales bacterium]|nr:DUF1800 family protein [Candidatus Caenarcaniphilales bacterium]
MIKRKNYFQRTFVTLLIVSSLFFISGIAKAFEFPSPISSITLKSSNADHPRQVRVGETIHLKIDFDKDYSFESVNFFEENYTSDLVCDDTNCSVSFDINVTEAMLSKKAELAFKYKKNDQTRVIVFDNPPIHLLAANASLKDVAYIKLRSNNPSFQNLAFIDDTLTLSFLSRPDFETSEIQAIKISGIDVPLTDVETAISNRLENKTIHLIKIPVKDEFPLGKVSFELIINNNIYNSTVNNLYPVIIPRSIQETVFTLNTDNTINPNFIANGNSMFVKFSSSPDLQVNSSTINGKAYEYKITKSCEGLSCENILTYKVDPELFSKKIDFKLNYTAGGFNKTYENSNTVVALADYVKHHVLNRLSFGKTSQTLEQIESSGWRSYVIEQLNPNSINDSKFEAMNSFTTLYSNHEQNLAYYLFDRMLYSKKQLLEKMTWFWENHFSTSIRKWNHVDWRYFNKKERYKADFTGRHRSGNFRDLGFHEIKPFISNDYIHKLGINTSDYDTLEIRARFDQSDDEPLSKIYWKNEVEEEDFKDEKSVSFQAPYDRSTQVYTLKLSDNPNWTGTLTGMAIEPFTRTQDSGIRSRAMFYYMKLIDSSGTNPDKLILYTSSYAERWTNDFFRANAFGNFIDILKNNAKSPSMLFYLDNYLNNKAYANENYAREIMELHALGVNGGYTEEDVRNVAELFTGLTYITDKVFFDETQHQFQDLEVSFLNETIPGGTTKEDFVNQVDTFLEKLGSHPSTAKFICKKLIEYFIDENIPSNLQTVCETSFLANTSDPNQLKKVMESILLDEEFISYTHYRNKIANPMFQSLQVMRAAVDYNLDENYNSGYKNTIYGQAASQEFVPGFAGPPTGYKEKSTSWMNQGQLVKRIAFNKRVANGNAYRGESLTKTIEKFNGKTKEDFLRYVLDLFVADSYTDEEFNALLAIFPEDFEINNSSNNIATMRKIFFLAASMPRAQLF